MTESMESPGATADRPMRAREAAGYLGIALGTLYKLTSARRVRFYKPAKHVLFFRTDLDLFIREHEHEPLEKLADQQEAQRVVRPEPRLRGRRVTA